MASLSMKLGPSVDSNATAFIKSHFFTKVPRPPADTDLSGQVGIITGASSGLGYHAACHFLSLRLSHLILAVRSPEKGEAIATKFRAAHPAANVDVWPLEMTSYESIQNFCLQIETKLSRLDFMILNSGMIAPDFGKCPNTGHERVVQVNYLSTFLLAILMLPLSKKLAPPDKPGRLTIVSSGTVSWAKLKNRFKRPFLASFDNPTIEPWDPGERYYASKALGHLFFARLINYLDADEVVVNLVEPGFTKGSELHRDATGITALSLWTVKALTARNVEDAAWTYVDAAITKGKESHGCFCEDCKIHPFCKIIYTREGQLLMDVLWEETLAEFEFAGVRKILNVQ